MPGLLRASDLDLCGELEEDLRVMVGYFVQVCRRRGIKVNRGKSKVMLLGGEEGLECEVCVNAIRFEHVSEFKYLGCFFNESGTYEVECSRKLARGMRVTSAIRYG